MDDLSHGERIGKAYRNEMELSRLRAELADRDKRLADLRRPTHGPCCTCQRCGKDYDSCRCYLDEVVDDLEKANAELAAERERTAGLAAALEKANDDLRFMGLSYAIDVATPKTILAARDADQRRKGAAWALKRYAMPDEYGNEQLRKYISGRIADIERGEAEVGE